jgi:hypothetical protein
MVRIFHAANARLVSGLPGHLLAATAEQGAVNRTHLVPAEFHSASCELIEIAEREWKTWVWGFQARSYLSWQEMFCFELREA